uniref:Caspase recruitment domain family, member 11 n=1 Tax=Nothobranchius rachovii TaxID=451742 RepID=A0A1A8SMH5_9TELE
MYHNRIDTLTAQLEEVEKERDQAFRARDDAQHQFSQSLLDKDKYRKQIRELEEKSDELHIEIVRKEAKMHRPNMLRNRNDSILSILPEPPEKASLYRREKEKEEDFLPRSLSDFDSDNMEMECEDAPNSVISSSSSHQSEGMDMYDLEQVNNIFRKLSLERPFRLSLSSLSRVSSTVKPVQELSLLGDNLLKEIMLVGGNESGIFVSSVQIGSVAEKAGLREGHHLLMLEGPVTPQKAQRRRPVLFAPAALAKTIIQKILNMGAAMDFNICKPDFLSKEEFHLKQNVEPFIHYKEKQTTFECITRENVEAVAAKGKHCLLEAELSCVKDLLRREIYPIIIYVKICEKNVKKLRKLPLRVESEEELVRLCRSKEKELDGVPCLYATLEPESWAGTDDLIRVIKDRILDEQRKTVWVEQDLL